MKGGVCFGWHEPTDRSLYFNPVQLVFGVSERRGCINKTHYWNQLKDDADEADEIFTSCMHAELRGVEMVQPW